MKLLNIKDMLQEVSLATSKLLNVDVEIIDTELVRIVGTGRLKTLEGAKVERKGMLADFFNNSKGKRLVVENPGFEPFCQNCPMLHKCIYKKAVYSSIVYQGKTLGVMGIVTFEENANNFMQYNSTDLLQFIEKVCSLITDKFTEEKIETEGSIQRIVHSLDRGIIILNNQLEVKYYNKFLDTIINLNNNKAKDIYDIFPSIDVTPSEGRYRRLVYNGKKLLYRVLREEDKDHKIEIILDIIYDSSVPKHNSNTITISDIIGEDKEFIKFKEKVLQFSKYDSTILLVGDTGTGKELFARAIHNHSNRCENPFIIINCSSIPESLIESELFGYEKGSFTGADVKGKKGKILQGNGGTIFLDEVEAIPLYIQAKLLRLLENRTLERIGSTKEIYVDIRVIAASNVRLDEMVDKKEFREDLYHRLNVIPLFIPSLIDRKDDILLLSKFYIQYYNQKFNKNIKDLNDDVKVIFNNYCWRGNVRELKNAIEYSVNLETGDYITTSSLPYQILSAKINVDTTHLIEPLDIVEWNHIKKALDLYGWSDEGKVKAAKILQISRSTIYRKINKYKLLYNK